MLQPTLSEDPTLERWWVTPLRRFIANKLGMIGFSLTIVYFIIAIVGPLIVQTDPNAIYPSDRLMPPSPEAPFGTDRYGRSVLARTLVGARISLKVASIVVTFSTIVGVAFGLVAGFYRGKFDELIMRTVDILFAFPSVLLALVIIAILGPGLNKAIIALSIAFTPTMIRVTRGSALAIRQEEYVTAAMAYGESNVGIMFRDMLPNIASPVIVQATITFAYATIAEAGLSYLGLSAQPPTATWGVMISIGQSVIEFAPWASFFPGLAVMLTVLGLTLFGIGLRDALDPKAEMSTQSFRGM